MIFKLEFYVTSQVAARKENAVLYGRAGVSAHERGLADA